MFFLFFMLKYRKERRIVMKEPPKPTLPTFCVEDPITENFAKFTQFLQLNDDLHSFKRAKGLYELFCKSMTIKYKEIALEATPKPPSVQDIQFVSDNYQEEVS